MGCLVRLLLFSGCLLSGELVAAQTPAIEAVDWQRSEVYRAPRKPAYSAWVSLFPGDEKQWYLSFEEVQPVDPPRPRASLDYWYRMGLPDGYDKSPYRLDIVLMQSNDDCKTWREIARNDTQQFQHTVGAFAQVRTRDQRFLGARWTCYSLEETRRPGQFMFESADEGATWTAQPPLLDDRFSVFPHRMKQLRDGTIVLAAPYGLMWGADKSIPIRTSKLPMAIEDCSMALFTSADEGRTWDGPTGIFPGRNVSETDFVELPSGDVLAFVGTVFGAPGRQVIHRVGKRFVPGPYELIRQPQVPETVALTADGVIVGALRNGPYMWSDDEGITWQPLVGSETCGYQPMMRQLADGRLVCGWHHGADDAIDAADQYIGLDIFHVQINRRTAKTRLAIERVFDEKQNRFLNEYDLALTVDGRPVTGKPVTLWYAVQGDPGYEPYNRGILPDRMATGGKTVAGATNTEGRARLVLPESELPAAAHYQVAAVFNADRSDPAYVPAASAICGFYVTSHGNDPTLSTSP